MQDAGSSGETGGGVRFQRGRGNGVSEEEGEGAICEGVGREV